MQTLSLHKATSLTLPALAFWKKSSRKGSRISSKCASYTAIDEAEIRKEMVFALRVTELQVSATLCAANNNDLAYSPTDDVFPFLKLPCNGCD